MLASSVGGNVELILLFATLLATRLLWRGWAPLAAPPIALVVAIKPFYALFLLVFGLLRLLGRPLALRETARTLLVTSGLTLALLALEVSRWGAPLRAATVRYLRQALDYHWFVLPAAEQTPMSAWNRTPLQALVSAGAPLTLAQGTALLLWLLFVAITAWRAWGAPLTFPLAFALSLVLLYWGRPIGWTMTYLEVVLTVTVWPTLGRWQRAALLGAVAAVMGSHWWALALTVRGEGMPLVTLQRADVPWETWSLVPLSWLLLLRALPSAPAPPAVAPARLPSTKQR